MVEPFQNWEKVICGRIALPLEVDAKVHEEGGTGLGEPWDVYSWSRVPEVRVRYYQAVNLVSRPLRYAAEDGYELVISH